MKINALFVIENGPYYGLENIVPWSEKENAFNCKNGAPAIAHPPCKRWGRYWSGGPSASKKFYKGDDNGCFAFALWYIRTFGGIIEHPEATHAYDWFGLKRPSFNGGWTDPDIYGGRTCCVSQGNYGHKARKITWLYGVNINFKELNWDIPKGMMRMELGPRSKEDALVKRAQGVKVNRLSVYERLATPKEFKNLLIELVSSNSE